MNQAEKIKFVFFGSSEFSVYVLNELKLHGLIPSLIVTTPDKPVGRKLVLTPTPVKIWAQENGVDVLDPAKLKNNADLNSKLQALSSELFLVASYGKIIPKEIFEIPERKTLNIHPSLLPKYRGASPIQAQILNDEKEIGVTIMEIVEEMDAGPIVIQKRITPFTLNEEQEKTDTFSPLSFARRGVWAVQALRALRLERGEVIGRIELEKILAKEGARLFVHILPEWLSGMIDPVIQNEAQATYCNKISKTDGQITFDISNPPQGLEARKALLKIKAYEGWPGTYFFHQQKRIAIKEAEIENDSLKILRVVPEGKKEMPFTDFLRGL